MTAIVDFHIHLYRGFDLQAAYSAALNNTGARFGGEAQTLPHVCCLTERSGQNWFAALRSAESEPISLLPEGWTPQLTEDGLAIHFDLAPSPFYLVAGRQIVTSERLELLCLTVDLELPDGIPMREGIAKIREAGGIPMIPWSPGKWMGARGKFLHDLLQEKHEVYLGDTAIRPGSAWGKSHFSEIERQGLPVLPGSDPLPAIGETSLFCKLSAKLDIPCENPGSELRAWVKQNRELIYPESTGGIVSMLRRMANMKFHKIEI